MSAIIKDIVVPYFEGLGLRVLREWSSHRVFMPVQLKQVPGVPASAWPLLLVEARVEPGPTDVLLIVELGTVPYGREAAVAELAVEVIQRRPYVRFYHRWHTVYAEVYLRLNTAANPRVELEFAYEQLLGAINEHYGTVLTILYGQAGKATSLLERQVAKITGTITRE